MLGDFNAKIGKEQTFKRTIEKESLHDTSNENGERLIILVLASNIIISSTCFPCKNIHKETWVFPNGLVKTQIDYTLIDAKRRRYITDVRSHRRVSGSSDHFLVKIKIKIKLAVKKREEKLFKNQFNIKELENPEIVKNSRENIAQNIQQQKEITEDNAETFRANLEQTLNSTTKATLGLQKKKKRKIINGLTMTARRL